MTPSFPHDIQYSDSIPSALEGIGMAILVVDRAGQIRLVNSVAEKLTGWSRSEAIGQPINLVFRIEREANGEPITDVLVEVLLTGMPQQLSDHTVLIGRNQSRCRIDHGTSPVRNSDQQVVGAVLFFCDVSDRQRIAQAVEDARVFAEGIVQTVREPLLVLDSELRVRLANRAFYNTFRLTPAETESKSLFTLGDQPWEIPELRTLLQRIVSEGSHFDDFIVEHEFQKLGRRTMVLNARRLPGKSFSPGLVLLSIEDATHRQQANEALAVSETRYRRLFETAQDGILLVHPRDRKIFDANPFLTDLLGYSHSDLVGKELWEIGLFQEADANKVAFGKLLREGYIRYDDLPLRTHDDRQIEVEFVSNIYDVGETKVIQCNIRDVTDRKRAQYALEIAHASLEIRVQKRTVELAEANESLKNEIRLREAAEADRRNLQQQLTTVQEDERRRIARELHDEMGQHLTALGLGLKVAKDATADPSLERDRLQSLQTMTDLIGKEIHHLALELRPTALDDLGLQAALVNYTEGWSERTGIELDFHSVGLDVNRLPPAIETAIYRVIQEALTNILKHATAQRVSVVLQRKIDFVSALVEDDGRGFDAEAVDVNRLGILGMRERVALVGGTLVVESGLNQGTTVIARIPLT
ncbi:PAS domain S-box protein [Telmatocola sphagniphila]|uniref:histidine kinase n=1 Tax=Telmatocola sphagniphila TaxID=1123043 RepID=A0A8E6BC16_9BACT|nr:PAS domain S-box protein [Telmatocola sphagniphila]QVL34115.1 PAS domain S-box protein [Telmatocola sphagniphila]